MKIKTLIILIGIIMSHSISLAQKKEYKFGKVAPEEFQIVATGVDTGAAAIKIFDVGSCRFELNNSGLIYVFEKHVRYKILTKSGYDLANYTVNLYRGEKSGKEDLSFMDAATYNMVDGKMVVSKLNKESKFTEEYNKRYTLKKFALANVKEGSIIEFKYAIKSDMIFNLRGWSFQSDIPTIHTEYNVRIPEYFVYKTNLTGYYMVNQTKHEKENSPMVPGETTVVMYDQYMLDNVPALRDEAYITTLDDYRPMIDFELKATRFPGETYVDYTGTWPKLIKSLDEDEQFGLFINKNAHAKSILPNLLKAEKDTLAITKLIFDYVKNNIKWNDEHNFVASTTSPKAVFDKKSGNSADINLSLISLLKEAKINAYPLLISTRDNGIHPGYPIISKFNNVVAHVIINNKDVLLDATDRDLPIGMVDYNNLSHQAFSVDLKGVKGRWILTEPTFNSERIYNYNLVLDKDNKLTGKLNQYAKGYAALNVRNRYRSKNNEAEFLKDLKKDKVGLNISNYKISNLNELDELLSEELDVVIEDNVEETGNLVYFMPLLFERTKENLFKHEERVFPVDFGYPLKENYRITVTFPENYDIDKLPQSLAYKIPDNKGTFSISFLSEGKTLLVKSIIDINKAVYSPEEYFHLKELFKAIVQKQAEQIVFKKKA